VECNSLCILNDMFCVLMKGCGCFMDWMPNYFMTYFCRLSLNTMSGVTMWLRFQTNDCTCCSSCVSKGCDKCLDVVFCAIILSIITCALSAWGGRSLLFLDCCMVLFSFYVEVFVENACVCISSVHLIVCSVHCYAVRLIIAFVDVNKTYLILSYLR